MKSTLLAQLSSANDCFGRSTAALAEGVYTAAQQVAHAAQTIDWFMEGAFSPQGFDLDFEAQDRKVREVTSLADARARLSRAVENAQELVNSKSDEEWSQPLADGPIMGGQPRAAVFGGITDHTAHHRGALTVYSRLLGKTPPNPYIPID